MCVSMIGRRWPLDFSLARYSSTAARAPLSAAYAVGTLCIMNHAAAPMQPLMKLRRRMALPRMLIDFLPISFFVFASLTRPVFGHSRQLHRRELSTVL